MATVYCKAGAATVPVTVTTGTTNNFAFGQTYLTSASVGNSNITMRTSGSINKLGIYISANTITNASTLTTRKNSAAGNQSVTIAESTTGYFEDTTNADSIASSDTLAYRLVAGNAGTSLVLYSISTNFLANTDTAQRYICGGIQSFTGTSVSAYCPVAGTIYTTATEANTQVKAKASYTGKNFFVHVNANARSSATTVFFRKNTGNGNMNVSVTAATTGVFEDTSNTDSLVSGDVINYGINLGTGTGSFSIANAAFDGVSTANQFQLVAASLPNSLGSNATFYMTPSGEASTTTTEANVSTKTNLTATISNLAIFVVTNSVVTASTLKFRKNGADGNQVVSITGLTTGYFEDTINTDTIVPTDLINYSVTTASGVAQHLGWGTLSSLVTQSTLLSHLLTILGVGA